MALAAPLAAAMCNDRLTLPTLTYISIGFVSNLIYAEENFGADHNMLLILGVRGRLGLGVPRAGHGLLRAVAEIRTLATKCCYAVTGGELQVWRVLVRGCVASLAEGLHSLEIVGCSGARVRNKNVPGFTTDYEDLMKRPPQLAVLS